MATTKAAGKSSKKAAAKTSKKAASKTSKKAAGKSSKTGAAKKGGGNTQTANPHFVGTWRLNVEESRFVSIPAMEDEVVTISARCAVTMAPTLEGGRQHELSYQGLPKSRNSRFDLRNTAGDDNAQIVSRKVNMRTYEHTWRVAGVETRARAVVSADGQTMTYTIESVGGKRAKDVLVFYKEK